MEMTANFWNPSAGGAGDWRSALLARAPQVVTFVLALALAAQLAFIVVAMTSRSRQAAPPPIAAIGTRAPAGHRRPGQRPSVRQCRRTGKRRRGERAAVEHAAGSGGRARHGRSQARNGHHWRKRPGGEGRLGRASRFPAAPSCTRSTATAPSSIAAERWSPCSCPPQRGRAVHAFSDGRPRAGRRADTNEAMIERMRKLVNDDPGVIGQVMRPQPVFAGGEMKGFRVYPGANRQAFSRMGLRAGDMVTAINGTPLNDKDRAQEIFGTLASSTDARVTITRNGRQQELVLNIAQITAEAERMGGGWGWQYPASTRRPGRTGARERITNMNRVLMQ